MNPFYASGSTTDDKPEVSRSYQEYETNKDEFPITQPLLKKEGLIQCAGEAVYSDDMPTIKDEVFASLVLATITNGDIESIDGSKALVSKQKTHTNFCLTPIPLTQLIIFRK